MRHKNGNFKSIMEYNRTIKSKLPYRINDGGYIWVTTENRG